MNAADTAWMLVASRLFLRGVGLDVTMHGEEAYVQAGGSESMA